MIPQRSISLLSNRLAGAGGRRIREDVLERDYCLAWFLSALSKSELRSVLAFKGGTALKRFYFGDYRFSEDLDFTLLEEVPLQTLFQRFEQVYQDIRESCGISFAFDREDRQKHANSFTFYLKYTGPLPGGNDVKLDITISEKLVFPLQQKPVLRGYDEYTDLPDGRSLQVYSLEEIATEKIIALADRARNEPRDLYDLWYLTTYGSVQLDHLAGAIQEKLAFRGRPCEGLEAAIDRKGPRLETLWTSRLAYQMIKLPRFDEVFRSLRRTLRQASLP